MEINLTDTYKQILQVFLLLILPWIVIIIGLAYPIQNGMYYLLSITWFGAGVIFFSALN